MNDAIDPKRYPNVIKDVFDSKQIDFSHLEINQHDFSGQLNEYQTLNAQCSEIIYSKLSELTPKYLSIPPSEIDASKSKAASFTKTTNQLNNTFDAFKNRFSPLCIMSTIDNNMRRLEILQKLNQISDLSKQFIALFGKRSKSLTDISKLMYLKSEIDAKINGHFDQLLVCQQIQSETSEKVNSLSSTINKIVSKREMKNLTISEVFALILLSKSPKQFLGFFSFSKSLFPTLPDGKVQLSIKPVLEFDRTFQALVPYVERNEFTRDYISAYQKKKLHNESRITTFINAQIDSIPTSPDQNQMSYFLCFEILNRFLPSLNDLDLYFSDKGKFLTIKQRILTICEDVYQKPFFDPKFQQIPLSTVAQQIECLIPIIFKSPIPELRELALRIMSQSFKAIGRILKDHFGEQKRSISLSTVTYKYSKTIDANVYDIFCYTTKFIETYNSELLKCLQSDPSLGNYTMPEKILTFFSLHTYTNSIIPAFIMIKKDSGEVNHELIDQFPWTSDIHKQNFISSVQKHINESPKKKKKLFGLI